MNSFAHIDAKTIQRLDDFAIAFSQRLSGLGILGMLIIGVFASLDVLIFRAIFNSPIVGFIEILQTIFAVAIASVLASGFAQRANLQVDLVSRYLSGRAMAWLEVVVSLMLLAMMIVLAWRAGIAAVQAGTIGKQTVILELQVAPFYWAITALIALCVPVQFTVFLKALLGAKSPLPHDGEAGKRDETAPSLSWISILLSLVGAVLVISVLVSFVSFIAPMVENNPVGIAIAMFVFLWVLVLLMAPVGFALGLSGLVGIALLIGWHRALLFVGSETMGLFTNAEIALIPLFLMMGAFATVSGMSADIYRLAHAAFGARSGGVAMATVAGCAGFGALTGSSIATAATIGSVALPEMRQRGYASSLATGCVAAGATLGQLVPPSTIIVLYAILVEESIGKLYVAILLPALLSMVLYLVAIAILVKIRPEIAPGKDKFSITELLSALYQSVGVLVLFVGVIGGIYVGIFTATEAAAIGAVFTFLIALARGKLNRDTIWEVASETTRAVALIYVLIIGALIMSFFISLSGLAEHLTSMLANSGLPPLAIIICLVVAFILMGTVMDATAVMIITAGVVAPLVASLGYNPLWWGVMMVVLVEVGVVTPPFGINLFVLKNLQRDVPLSTIYKGVLPFVAVDLFKVALLIAFPAIAIWLPTTML